MAAPAEPKITTVRVDNDESSLWRSFKAQGSLKARETLFTRQASFARSIARRIHREQSRGDLELADLYQLAFAGLLEALDSFDPSNGTPFRAFAAHRISGSVRDGIGRLSEVREQIAWRVRARRERLRSLTGHQGDHSVSSTAVERLTELTMGLALGFMLEDTGLLMQGDGDAPGKTAYESVAWKETVAQLGLELAELPQREQMILRQHYIDGVGFDELASLLKLSRSRISQLHRSALLALRKRMRSRNHFRMVR